MKEGKKKCMDHGVQGNDRATETGHSIEVEHGGFDY